MRAEYNWYLEAYRRMKRVRVFEERVEDLVRSGEIPGSAHLCIGQEAAAVGACLALRPDDYITGTHRSHGHLIAKGSALGPIMAELLGKASGVCRGRGGSMHLADATVGMIGASGIVASAMPVAVGAALSAKYRRSGQVCVSFFGDGAVNEGAFHESMNLAAVWKLPVIFFCENNGYSVTMPIAEAVAIKNLASRAEAYGMPGATVDGQNVVQVLGEVSKAVARARAGDGPTLIEAETYRFAEHAVNFKIEDFYRSDAEAATWREIRDPIRIMQSRLTSLLPSNDAVVAIDTQVVSEVDSAVAFARSSALPLPEGTIRDADCG